MGVTTSRLATVLRAARPRFLTLAALSVLIGIGVAVRGGAPTPPAESLAILCAALLAHASVNLLNEYHDFRSGLDLLTARTPYSGGSGALPSDPQSAAAVLVSGYLCLALCILIGLWFIAIRGSALLPLGALGVLLVLAYTPRLARFPLPCLLAPGLGFGTVMVTGTAFVLTGRYDASAIAASLPPMFLAMELLLANQFPDVEADRQVGRRNVPIVLGRRRSALVLAVVVALAFCVVPLAVLARILPAATLLAFLPAPLALLVVRRFRVHADDLPALRPWLGRNVAIIHLTLLLFAVGLLVG